MTLNYNKINYNARIVIHYLFGIACNKHALLIFLKDHDSIPGIFFLYFIFSTLVTISLEMWPTNILQQWYKCTSFWKESVSWTVKERDRESEKKILTISPGSSMFGRHPHLIY